MQGETKTTTSSLPKKKGKTDGRKEWVRKKGRRGCDAGSIWVLLVAEERITLGSRRSRGKSCDGEGGSKGENNDQYVCVCLFVCVVTDTYVRLHVDNRAVRRRHSVGGGAPVNFGRRRRSVGARKHFFLRFPKNFLLPSNFSDDLFSHRKLQQNNFAATMAA